MLVQQLPRVLGFVIYREYQDGATVEELSAALNLPAAWVEERIEAVRMCLERQVRIELRPMPRARRVSTGLKSRRRSR